MWHDTTGSERNPKPASLDRTIRIQRMGTAVDEIVEAFAVFAEGDAQNDPRQREKLAAASRRLWTLASHPDHGPQT